MKLFSLSIGWIALGTTSNTTNNYAQHCGRYGSFETLSACIGYSCVSALAALLSLLLIVAVLKHQLRNGGKRFAFASA